jgi:ATP phosphoribosyltransferase-like protein
MFIRSNRRAIPRRVKSGTLIDAGITGQDIFLNAGYGLREYATLRFARRSDRPTRWVLAARPGFELDRFVPGKGVSEIHLNKITIACELHRFAEIVLARLDPPFPLDYEIVRIDGSEEQEVAGGDSDLALVVTETGDSIRENGLEILPGYDNVFESIPAIHLNDNFVDSKYPALEELTLALQSVIGAGDFVKVEFHFPKELELDRLRLPSDLGVTVSPLTTPGWHEGKVVVPRSQYPSVMRQLKKAGARNFIMDSIQGHLE